MQFSPPQPTATPPLHHARKPRSTNLDSQPSNIFPSTWTLIHRWIRLVINNLSSVQTPSISRLEENTDAEMKEGSGGGKRSESDKEKTKMRERQRRAITTNIFHGLRKHGGYRLSPRADINEVLRQLAHEAGWVILPDGTTYRAKVSSNCPLCGALWKTAAATSPTSNCGGECSTITLGAPLSSIKAGSSLFCFPESLNDGCRQPISVPAYTDQELTGEAQSSSGEGGRNNSDGGIVESSGMAMMTCEQQGELLHLEDLSRSNQRTMMGSPPYRSSGQRATS